jgi:PAS domain S-box-containing protein
MPRFNGVSANPNGGSEGSGADASGRPGPTRSAVERAERLSQTGSWEWDLDTDVLLWSDNMFRLLGLEPGAIVPRPEEVIERTHPDDRQRVVDEVEAARQARRPPDVTYRVIWPDGTIRVLRGTTALEGAGEDRSSRLIGSVQDMTALVAAQRETAESLTLMETLQAASPVGFAFVDRDLRIVHINEAMARTNGRRPQDYVGRTLPEMAPDIWPQLEPVFERVLETGRPVTNLEVERQQGGPAIPGYWLASYYPVNIGGDVIGVGVVVVDITEREEAEHLRAAVMETMMEGLCVLDGEGRLSYMNAAATRVLGWTEDELRGKNMHEVVHFQHADGSPHPLEDCELLKVRSEGRPVRMAHDAFTRKDGTIFPTAYSAAPLLSGTSVHGVVVVFRDTTTEAAEEQRVKRELDTLVWVGRIRDALDQGRMTLYSQPIVPLAGGRPSQELLLRMFGNNGEVVLPGTFLPVAERYGLIGEIDRWVIGEAIRIAAGGERVEANLSADSISNLDLVPLIERQLRDTGTDPANVVFEITETALMKDIEAGEAFARGLSDLGCQVALDDFGTGFGSFTYLKKLPITFLKIDTDFVRELRTNRANQHLVRAIVGLAQDFGYQTIAEGVEETETLAMLEEYGVDFAQGFHLGRPAPIQSR